MMSPSSDYTDEYNAWLASIPSYIYPIVFIIKRFYRSEWGENWREHFGVDEVNGITFFEVARQSRCSSTLHIDSRSQPAFVAAAKLNCCVSRD